MKALPRCFPCAFCAAFFLSFPSGAATEVATIQDSSFMMRQKTFDRVRVAFISKGRAVQQNLRGHGLRARDFHLLVVVFKAEARLELYGKASGAKRYGRIATYDICALSGGLGPKRRQGDRQVPEGFYEIDRFNPQSRYFLSLGLDYPNTADRLKNAADGDPGGDIFIHGDCVSIGCLAMTDDKIQEIYLYALFARESGQERIPVYSFPFRMTKANFAHYAEKYRDQPDLLAFWKTLQTGFSRFETSGFALPVRVDAQGNYRFDPDE
ncbi:MAG: L,D-transpeptidase family protein [Zoogloeaceae bacterium]|jgi:murein L,D-transpeptidase YafK|nr:L,D-transpeptidase family protein [Zoogloeaceae bacterium]